MATSGSVDYGVTFTANTIIQSSLEDLGIMAAGDTTSSTTFTDHSAGALIKLNLLVKQYGYPTDGSAGMQAWAIKRAYLFLQTGQAVYTLGPTTTETGATNKWAAAYSTTTLSQDEAASQSTITVADNGITIASGNRIGLELDSGAIHWTTVSGSVTDNGATIDVPITTATTGAAALGNRVFVYAHAATNQGRRPLEIISVVLRSTDGTDSPPLRAIRTTEEYEANPTKGADGQPTAFYYERTLKDGTLYFDSEPTDVTQVARITYRSPFEDFDTAANDDADFDPVWGRALVHSLSYELCPRFGLDARMPAIKALRDEALGIARNALPEVSDAHFMPGEPDY